VTEGVGVDVALRRVVVGYRLVGTLWVWLLAAVVLATETVELWPVLATGGVATIWAGATVWVGVARPQVFSSVWWLAADAVVSGLVLSLSAQAGADRGFTRGYPFSTVLLTAYAGGHRGAFVVAAYLSLVSFRELGSGDAIGPTLIYLAGAGVTAWAMQLLRRNEEQRRQLEQRLADERTERLRAEEREETGRTLHDGVLQTLALIQRRADDPAAVAGLARRQERDLRDWLSGGVRTGAGSTFAEAVKDLSAEIEAEHGLQVDVVTVGDAAMNAPREALVAAAAEAVRNVAKHAGVATASVYAEVTDTAITVFVRDRGGGFDVATVPADRRGISESILGRMRRHGGTAEIRTAPGEGTEIALHLPLPR
jgi:signal transduction histidine kinase